MGRAIALRYARPGCTVFVNYHADDDTARRTAEQITSRGATPPLVRADVGTIAGAQETVARAAAVTDRLDLIVHCAVDSAAGGVPALDIDPAAFARAVQCNASAMLVLVQSARPLLAAGSSVVFVTSRGSQATVPGYAAIGAPKALGEALVRYLAVELAGDGIRVNSVMGSTMDTQSLRAALGEEAARDRLAWAAETSPSGRLITVNDLVDAIEFPADW